MKEVDEILKDFPADGIVEIIPIQDEVQSSQYGKGLELRNRVNSISFEIKRQVGLDPYTNRPMYDSEWYDITPLDAENPRTTDNCGRASVYNKPIDILRALIMLPHYNHEEPHMGHFMLRAQDPAVRKLKEEALKDKETAKELKGLQRSAPKHLRKEVTRESEFKKTMGSMPVEEDELQEA